MKEFKDVQKGDWVFTIRSGWVKVDEVVGGTGYPVMLDYAWYTKEGRLRKHDTSPSAWLYDPLNGTSPPEPEIAWSKVPIDIDVFVSADDMVWFKRKFVVYIPSGDSTFYVSKISQNIKTTKGLAIFKYCKLGCEPKPEWLK